MKFKTVTVTTTHQDADLVSSAMFDVGAEGVTILDKQDFLDLVKSDIIWDYVDEEVLLKSDDVKVSTNFDFSDNLFVQNLENRLNEMKEYGVVFGEIVVNEIESKDYENEWKKYYDVIQTKNIMIVPSWLSVSLKPGQKMISLDPGMAFGTGSHPTTRMCLDLMDIENKTCIDVGCGSGILGIAACICGAKSVYMCDIDEQAVKFAKENAKMNNVDVIIEQADLIEKDIKADFIFANLTADILMRLSNGLDKHLNDGGQIVVSGIIDSRENEVIKCFEDAGYKIIDRMAMDDWRALKLIRK